MAKYFYFRLLKKIISISILVIYMISCTEFDQLLRVPLLVTHFVEHKLENNTISFGEFILIHYVEDYSFNGDYERDMDLPFKSLDGNSIQVVASIPSNGFYLKAKPIYTNEGKFTLFEECFINNAYLSSIWQPPKELSAISC